MKLSLKGICKSFGAGYVQDHVDFEVETGEICALLGENGAGKSTLMNIVGGILSPDEGQIYVNGTERAFSSPLDSLRAGIAFIHQELNLINDLTVYENLFLYHFPKKGLFQDNKLMIEKARRVFRDMGLQLDPTVMVRDLDVSYKQMVEIARALLMNASLIIMDEPTASLNEPEIQKVFEIMRKLKDDGISMIFISHKLNEVMEICDRYTVLRNGKNIETGAICDVTAEHLAACMVGHEITVKKQKADRKIGEEVLKAEGLSDPEDRFRNISFSVRAGEILGVTGLLGDGRSELFESIFGMDAEGMSGTLFLNGTEIRPKAPEEALKLGIAYLPKNRKENAVIESMSVLDNATMATLHDYVSHGIIHKKRQVKALDQKTEGLHILYSDADASITALSGGNQQKIILSRWLLSDPKVLILNNPTQGVDIGAKEEIYEAIEELAAEGMSVIILSSEPQEIERLCDRCLIMYQGGIATEVSGETMTEQHMLYLAAGGKDTKTT